MKDTGYGTDRDYSSAYYSDLNLPPEDSLQIKDNLKSCSQSVLYWEAPLYPRMGHTKSR